MTAWVVLPLVVLVVTVLVVTVAMLQRPVRARDLGSVSRQWISEHSTSDRSFGDE